MKGNLGMKTSFARTGFFFREIHGRVRNKSGFGSARRENLPYLQFSLMITRLYAVHQIPHTNGLRLAFSPPKVIPQVLNSIPIRAPWWSKTSSEWSCIVATRNVTPGSTINEHVSRSARSDRERRDRAALNIEVLRADEGEVSKGEGKLEIPEKTRRPAASSGTIPTRENPGVTPPGIEPGSPRWRRRKIHRAYCQFPLSTTVYGQTGFSPHDEQSSVRGGDWVSSGCSRHDRHALTTIAIWIVAEKKKREEEHARTQRKSEEQSEREKMERDSRRKGRETERERKRENREWEIKKENREKGERKKEEEKKGQHEYETRGTGVKSSAWDCRTSAEFQTRQPSVGQLEVERNQLTDGSGNSSEGCINLIREVVRQRQTSHNVAHVPAAAPSHTRMPSHFTSARQPPASENQSPVNSLSIPHYYVCIITIGKRLQQSCRFGPVHSRGGRDHLAHAWDVGKITGSCPFVRGLNVPREGGARNRVKFLSQQLLACPATNPRRTTLAYGHRATPECKAGGNGRSLRKHNDQRHSPARFPRAKIRE
ncbi:hypothetical protein PR048_033463 [Dryococelus australis]|uniref:Uncharacterized protein n=1 Tax=Dryococelus australis TaxID=614101 RepID=A0ABQ9G0D4_9NEOP|nr:hypothetical protein PR048_033463 [Dryococelus australis]